MFEARPPAKVNLTLSVDGLRPDGYHELSSVFLRVGLSDRLDMAPGPGPADRLTVTGLPGVPVQGNLVLKALAALRDYAAIDMPPLDVVLEKRIPAAAGLGGGSSDAAYALRLAQAAWGIRVARRDELSLAEALGADVPFFYFEMPAAHVTGRGESLSALPSPIGSLGVLLLHPDVPLSTPRVFARFDEMEAAPRPRPSLEELPADEAIEARFLDELSSDELIQWAATAREPNDLWQAAVALEPALGDIRERLQLQTRVRWLMSGSGSTLFALYASLPEAVAAGQALAAARLPELEGALINAVDLVGPDPAWRYP